jgi:hypothetical protein
MTDCELPPLTPQSKAPAMLPDPTGGFRKTSDFPTARELRELL